MIRLKVSYKKALNQDVLFKQTKRVIKLLNNRYNKNYDKINFSFGIVNLCDSQLYVEFFE